MRPRCRRANPASRRPRRKLTGSFLSAVKVDDHGERPPADRAERDLVAREHDAVFLRPVVALRLVERTLEGADLPRMGVRPEELRLEDLLLAEEGVDLVLGPVLGAKLPALLLRLARGLLELGFLPCRRYGCPRS